MDREKYESSICDLAERDLLKTALLSDLLGQLIAECREEAPQELIRKGMGEAPHTEEELAAAIVWLQDAVLNEPAKLAALRLIEMVRHLEARIAFLCHDNEAWQDGYQRGNEDGFKEGVHSALAALRGPGK